MLWEILKENEWNQNHIYYYMCLTSTDWEHYCVCDEETEYLYIS